MVLFHVPCARLRMSVQCVWTQTNWVGQYLMPWARCSRRGRWTWASISWRTVFQRALAQWTHWQSLDWRKTSWAVPYQSLCTSQCKCHILRCQTTSCKAVFLWPLAISPTSTWATTTWVAHFWAPSSVGTWCPSSFRTTRWVALSRMPLARCWGFSDCLYRTTSFLARSLMGFWEGSSAWKQFLQQATISFVAAYGLHHHSRPSLSMATSWQEVCPLSCLEWWFGWLQATCSKGPFRWAQERSPSCSHWKFQASHPRRKVCKGHYRRAYPEIACWSISLHLITNLQVSLLRSVPLWRCLISTTMSSRCSRRCLSRMLRRLLLPLTTTVSGAATSWCTTTTCRVPSHPVAMYLQACLLLLLEIRFYTQGEDGQLGCQSLSAPNDAILCNCDCDSLTLRKEWQRFLAPVWLTPQRPCDSWTQWRIASDCDYLCDFLKRISPHRDCDFWCSQVRARAREAPLGLTERGRRPSEGERSGWHFVGDCRRHSNARWQAIDLRFRSLQRKSGMARVRLADLNGPKWTSSGQNGPFWSILVSRMLKSSSE